MIAASPRRNGSATRFTRRPLEEWTAAARAQWYLVRARLALLLKPKGRLLAAVSPLAAPATPSPEAMVRARQLALAVDRAAEHGLFRPTCLVRTIALERYLKREGVAGAVVRIGARQRNGRPEMHAWMEIGGTVLGDQPDAISTFTPLHDFTAARRP